MEQDQVRRLAAIMMLDVAGYSALMARDEARTLSLVTALRRDIVAPEIARHGGRIVKLMGDGVLAEFAAATAAVTCAVAIQRAAEGREAGPDLPRLRIGINLGEVIAEDGDIHGNGVNVAARIEALAEPGGIAVSASVHEQVGTRLPVRFRDMGAHSVKNIPDPVRVWQVVPGDGPPGAAPATPPKARGRVRAAALVAALVGLAALAGWALIPSGQATDPGAAVAPVVERPSVAVLPFENLSGDPGQSYFSDGITDSLITDLSRIHGLLVIARNTTFSFRDTEESMDAQSVAAALGVRYVVTGSVQRSGDRVRISANLVDAGSGFQVWAERLDRQFSDLFALQDEVTAEIIAALQVELTQQERRNLAKRYTDSLAAYDLFLRASEAIWRFTEADQLEARRLLQAALDIDPDFALATAYLATTYTNINALVPGDAETGLDRAFELATAAVRSAPELPQVHSTLAQIHMFRREYERADAAFSRVIDLDPNSADNLAMRAWNAQYAGRLQDALEGIELAFRLNPRAPAPYYNALGEIQFGLKDYAASLLAFETSIGRNPAAVRPRLFLAATLYRLGRVGDAEWAMEELLLTRPGLTLRDVSFFAPISDPDHAGDLHDALRGAGLPE